MTDSKPWFLSKSIWASLVAILAAVASAIGIEIDSAARTELTDAAFQLVTIGASLAALFGRLVATSRIE